MNLFKKNIYAELSASEAVTAAMAEGAIDLQGSYCQRVVSCDGRVSDLSAEAVKGALALEGLVEFTVLYVNGENGLDSVTGVCPFTHRMSAPQAEPGMDVHVRSAVSSPAARAAGPSRLIVEAVVELDAEVGGVEPLEVVADVSDNRLQTRRQQMYWMSKSASGRAATTVREDVEIGDSQPQVTKVLLSHGDVRVNEVRAMGNEAMVDGDLLLQVLYLDGEGSVNRSTFTVPFGASVAAAGMAEEMEVRAWGSVSQLFINVGENLNDERRILSLEAPLHLNVEGYAPSEMEALADAYHLDYDLGMTSEEVGLFDGPVELSEKVKVRGTLPRTDVLEEGAELLASDLTPVIDNYEVTEGRVDFAGRLITRVLYRTPDQEIFSTLAEAPFVSALEWAGATADAKMEMSALPLKCSVEARDTFDVDAEIEVNLVSRRCLHYSVVTELEQGVALNRVMAPLTLCVAGPDDTTWTLARRCRVKVEDLLRANPELSSGVLPGAKVVVLRK